MDLVAGTVVAPAVMNQIEVMTKPDSYPLEWLRKLMVSGDEYKRRQKCVSLLEPPGQEMMGLSGSGMMHKLVWYPIQGISYLCMKISTLSGNIRLSLKEQYLIVSRSSGSEV